eukprot:105443-Amphidinium_carterae.2
MHPKRAQRPEVDHAMATAVVNPRDDDNIQLPPGPPEVTLAPAPELEGTVAHVTIKTLLNKVQQRQRQLRRYATQ